MSDLDQNLKSEFQDLEYRYAYAESFLNTKLATQIKTLREQRKKTQVEIGARMGIKQPGYRRFEDVNHSVWKTDTLWAIAKALGVRLNISFETFGSLLDDKKRFTKGDLERLEFKDDPAFKESEKPKDEIAALVPVIDPIAPIVPRVSDLFLAVAEQHEELRKTLIASMDLSPILTAFKSQLESDAESWRTVIAGIVSPTVNQVLQSTLADCAAQFEALTRITMPPSFNFDLISQQDSPSRTLPRGVLKSVSNFPIKGAIPARNQSSMGALQDRAA
jgi:transcriptional regulator with XRE-family HTH domain